MSTSAVKDLSPNIETVLDHLKADISNLLWRKSNSPGAVFHEFLPGSHFGLKNNNLYEIEIKDNSLASGQAIQLSVKEYNLVGSKTINSKSTWE